MGKFIDMTGTVFGRLTVIGQTEGRGSGGAIIWRCQCSCGNVTEVSGNSLRHAGTKSCGCITKERALILNRKHGGTKNGKESRTYSAWKNAKKRCYYPKTPNYENYGGRGIRMCDAWVNDFEAFRRDMGECPEGQTLDRRDSNGDYSPENCRWATRREQQGNLRKNVWITDLAGRSMILADWARELGVSGCQLRSMLFARKRPITIDEVKALQSIAGQENACGSSLEGIGGCDRSSASPGSGSAQSLEC